MSPLTQPTTIRAFNQLQLSIGTKFYAKVWRRYAKVTKTHMEFDRAAPSSLKLDVVSPLAEKDLPVFRYSAQSIREHLLHPIGHHYLVGRDSALMREAARDMSCTFVDEREVCPEGIEFYKVAIAGTSCNRAGWLYQQMLKLNMNHFCESGRFITVDADTVFIRPVRYEINDRIIFDVSDSYREDFDAFLKQMLPGERRAPFSFMCHIMIMENECLRLLQEHLQKISSMDWRPGILKFIDFEKPEYFSEFELYANFVLNRWPERYTRSYWFNRRLWSQLSSEAEQHMRANSSRCKSVSFHERGSGSIPPK